MRIISADFIYTLKSKVPLTDHVIIMDGEVVKAIRSTGDYDASQIEFYPGALCPGFVNSHCHLELSHLLGVIPTGTKLIPFISDVVTKRDFPEALIQTKIDEADEYMWQAGIQAVGDISNTADTFNRKANSKIYYHTFIELFDLMQAQNAKDHFNSGKDLLKKARALNISANLSPHAPYSVSPNLYKLISGESKGGILSIHNQETEPEDQFFLKGEGDFLTFYENFGLSLEGFRKTSKSSLRSILPYLDADTTVMFVHNSFTRTTDMDAAKKHLKRVYWCTCPSANLYIENRLPDYNVLAAEGNSLVVGTDSLSSNWQLSILEELKLIKKYHNRIDTQTLLNWACLNGSEALSLDHKLGSLEEGKTPGLLHINTDSKGEIHDKTVVRRLC